MADIKGSCESSATAWIIKQHDLKHAKCERHKWFITGKKINGVLAEVCTLCGETLKTHNFFVSKLNLFDGDDDD